METPEPTTPRKDRGPLAVGIIVGVVIVALIAAGVVLIPRLLAPTASTVNVTTAAMPANTQIYFSFNPHFDQLPNGGVVLKAWNDPAIAESIESGVRDALQDSDLDWEQDVASWLGDEVGIGMWDLKLDDSAAGSEPPASAVIVAATRDTAKSDAFLAKWRSAREADGSEFKEEAYRDVATVLPIGDDPSDPSGAYATRDGLVLFAINADSLHAALDALIDDSGLDRASDYQATLGKLRGGRAMTGYFNLGPIVKDMLEQMQASGNLPPTTINQASLDALEALQGAALGLSFEADGLLLELVATIDVSQLPPESLSQLSVPGSANHLLRAAPDSAFVYLGGEIQSEVFETMFDDPNFSQSAEMLESQLGIDLRQDVFSWLNGELAFVMMPGALGGASQVPFGFALVVTPSDKQQAEAALHGLVQKIAAQSNSSIEDVTIGDAQLHGVIDQFSGDPFLVYGLLGDNLVLALPDSAAEKIADAAGSPLADDETFKRAVQPLPASNSGYLYVRPKTIVDLVSLGLAFSGQECPACDWFGPVRAIALAGEQPPAEAGIGRTVMFALLDVEE